MLRSSAVEPHHVRLHAGAGVAAAEAGIAAEPPAAAAGARAGAEARGDTIAAAHIARTTAAGAAGALAATGTGASAAEARAGAVQGLVIAAAGALAAGLAALGPDALRALSAAAEGIAAGRGITAMMAGAGHPQAGGRLTGASGGLQRGHPMSPPRWGPSTAAGCTLCGPLGCLWPWQATGGTCWCTTRR